MKKTILVDLDGVLNTYDGNFDPDYIPPPREGAKKFLSDLKANYNIKIFTSRNKPIVHQWVIKHGFGEIIDDITSIKEPAWLYIDDRCISFDGDYKTVSDKIQEFRVWYE